MIDDQVVAEDEVRRVLRAIDAGWTTAAPELIADVLRPHFAEEAVVAGPDFAPLASGRDAAVASYADFAHMATIVAFEPEEATVHLAESTAIATYRWRVRYTMNDADYDEGGRDLFVLRHDGTRWLVTWRAMLPDPVP